MKRCLIPCALGLALVYLAGASPLAAMGEQGGQSAGPGDATSASGGASMEVPLPIPKGTGGFQPDLSLQYSSESGDGPFGLGWGIELGEIRRTTRFGTPAYDGTDQFELDGTLLVAGGTAGRFHTQTESFWRIERIAGDIWQVTFADGTRALYGSTANAKIVHDAGAEGVFRWLLSALIDVNGNTVLFTYDRSDAGTAYPQSISYTYRSGQLVGGIERRISFVLEPRSDPSVSFEGGVHADLTQRVNEVRATWSGLPYQRLILGYSAGYTTGRSRLASTQLFGNDCSPSEGDPVHNCVGMPPQAFTYRDDSAIAASASSQWEAVSWTIPEAFHAGSGNDTGSDQGVRFGDVNGDGRLDLVRSHRDKNGAVVQRVSLGTGSGWNADVNDPDNQAWSNALAALSFSGRRLRLLYSTSTGRVYNRQLLALPSKVFFGDATYFGNPVAEGTGTIDFDTPIQAIVADLDDDGYADILLSYAIGGGRYVTDPNHPADYPDTGGNVTYLPDEIVRLVFRNTGATTPGWTLDANLSTNLPPLYTFQFYASASLFSWPANGSNRCIGPQVFTLDGTCSTMLDFFDNGVLAGDVDRDGRLDLTLSREAEIPQLPPPNGVWLGKSTGWVSGGAGYLPPFEFREATQLLGPFDWNTDTGALLVDVNADGLPDLVKKGVPNPWGVVVPGYWESFEAEGVWLNTGEGWCGPTSGCSSDQARYGPPPMDFLTQGSDLGTQNSYRGAVMVVVAADVNGDGLPDLVHADGTPGGTSVAYIQDPAAPGGSVWVHDIRFDPPPGMETVSTHVFDDSGLLTERVVPTGVSLVDADDNGTPDWVKAYDTTRTAEASQLRFLDLLSAMENGQGGTVQLDYEASVAQSDPALEAMAEAHAASVGEPPGTGSQQRWANHAVVSAITTAGIGVGPFTTQLIYAHPRYSSAFRSLVGFRLVEALRPDGSRQRTYFWQDPGRAGQVARQEVEDAAGQLVGESDQTWEVVDGGGVIGSVSGALVGRQTYETQASLYAGQEGARRSITYSYADTTAGYNFVVQALIERSSGSLLVSRTRFDDPTSGAWFPGLVATEQHISGGITYRELTYDYEPGRGLLRQVTATVEERGATGGATTVSVSAAYDAFGNLISRTDLGQRQEFFCYDGDTSLGTAGCPSSLTQTHTVIAGSLDALGGLQSYTVDLPTATTTSIVRFNGDLAFIALDAFGRTTASYVKPVGASASTLLETRSYVDGTSNPVAQPYVEVFTEVGDGAGTVVRSARYADGLGGLAREVSEADAGTYTGRAFRRDFAGRLARQTYPLPCLTDPHCLALDPDTTTEAVATTYDALGRVVQTSTPEGTEAVYYGATSRTQPAGPGQGTAFDVALAKDRNGNLRQQLLDGDRTVWVDECHGTVAPGTTTLGGGECSTADSTFYVFEPTGEINTIYDAVAVASASYTDPRHFLRYAYDTLGRVTSIQDPDGGTSFQTYYPSGTLATTTNARGQLATFVYDDLDRLTEVYRVETAPAVTTTIDYDPTTRERSLVTGPGYSLSYSYDEFGRVSRRTQTTLGRTFHTDFDYDLLGRVTFLVYPVSDLALKYSYTGPNLTGVCEIDAQGNCLAAGGWIEGVTYDAIGRLDQVQSPPGVLTHTYDPLTQRLSELRLTNGSATPFDLTFGYDPLGDVTSITDRHDGYDSDGLDASGTYHYDQRGRIADWTRTSTGISRYFSYDPLGNLTGRDLDSPTASPNQLYQDSTRPHAISSRTTGETYAYDADGNTIVRGVGGAVQYLTYDSGSRVTCVGTAAGQCDLLSLLYDADGNHLAETDSNGSRILVGDILTWSTVNNVATSHVLALGRRIGDRYEPSSTLRTGWQPVGWRPPIDPGTVGTGLGIAALLLLLWALVRMGVPQAALRQPATAALIVVVTTAFLVPAQARAGSPPGGGGVTRRWFHADHLGTGVLVTNASGTVIHRRVFEPFGKVIAETTSPTQATDQLYTGQRYQAGIQLYDFRARWYDAETGRFLSVDPVIQSPQDPQSYNAYGYVRNNPLNNVDPDGLGFFSSIKKFFKKAHHFFKKVHEHIVKVVKVIVNVLKEIIVYVALVVVVVVAVWSIVVTEGTTIPFWAKVAGYVAEGVLAAQSTSRGITGRGVFDGPRVDRISLADAQPQGEPNGSGPIMGDPGVVEDAHFWDFLSTLFSFGLLKGAAGIGRALIGRFGREATEEAIEIGAHQFGRKLAKHAADFGLNPANPGDRAIFRKLIEEIAENPDRVVRGTFRGQEGKVDFLIRDADVVVRNRGKFVTILKDGINNPAVQRALGQ